ncbi:tetratricopeptide repeat protein [Ileibacterium valens]|uniref:tetratricopeptide repeat protein n=1 Tax=Ileibacterium valens TaxID=1862668 RepID=UPI002354950F|nr:hypothetical protein [Ileibacterium valens]
MWKYKCKSQVLTLLIGFIMGALLMVVTVGNSSYTEIPETMLPAETVRMLEMNPILIYLSGGCAIAGLCNVYIIGNVMSSQFGMSIFFWFLLLMIMPEYLIMFGIVTFPITLIVSLYGWISLHLSVQGRLKKRKISNDDEIVRIYEIHHPLLEEYKDMATGIRKTVNKITAIYFLGIIAVFCVMFFIDNLFVSIIAIFGYMFAFQFLTNYRIAQFQPISNLLYQQCNPEACMSALIYYSKRGNHYRLSNQSLMASCLIYLDDPELAQDVLITFPRSNPTSMLTYWSLMSYTYYLLKDMHGLERCRDEINKIQPKMGAMNIMIKSTEQASVENKIRLMNRDFQACKQYYLDLLKHSPSRLTQADCFYYIALISFVQEDYSIARMYFEKTIRTGNRLYFVQNAKNYLSKIEEIEPESADGIPYERYLP